MGVHGFTADQLFVEMSLCSHLLRYGPCGETDEYMIFGRIGDTDFYLGLE
ncbi:unnamed protein product [Brassica oleracea var. botrytis]